LISGAVIIGLLIIGLLIWTCVSKPRQTRVKVKKRDEENWTNLSNDYIPPIPDGLRGFIRRQQEQDLTSQVPTSQAATMGSEPHPGVRAKPSKGGYSYVVRNSSAGPSSRSVPEMRDNRVDGAQEAIMMAHRRRGSITTQVERYNGRNDNELDRKKGGRGERRRRVSAAEGNPRGARERDARQAESGSVYFGRLREDRRGKGKQKGSCENKQDYERRVSKREHTKQKPYLPKIWDKGAGGAQQKTYHEPKSRSRERYGTVLSSAQDVAGRGKWIERRSLRGAR
jgi:hypothetical protein